MNLMLMLVLSLMCYFFAGGYLKRLKVKNYMDLPFWWKS